MTDEEKKWVVELPIKCSTVKQAGWVFEKILNVELVLIAVSWAIYSWRGCMMYFYYPHHPAVSDIDPMMVVCGILVSIVIVFFGAITLYENLPTFECIKDGGE